MTSQPEKIGKYRVLGRIGRGGMGEVYKAHQDDLERPVAIKTMLAGEDASNEFLSRAPRSAEAIFLREGRIPEAQELVNVALERNDEGFDAVHLHGWFQWLLALDRQEPPEEIEVDDENDHPMSLLLQLLQHSAESRWDEAEEIFSRM